MAQELPEAPRCFSDRALREAGFRIVSRPKDGAPIWSKDGVRYTQADAVHLTVEMDEEEE